MQIEWVGAPGSQTVAVPTEVRDRCKFQFQAAAPIGFTGVCEDYEIVLGGILLRHALVDTSTRVNGLIMEARMTLRSELLILGGSVIVFPLSNVDAHA